MTFTYQSDQQIEEIAGAVLTGMTGVGCDQPATGTPSKVFRAGLYARVSPSDQQTIPLQIHGLREKRRPAGLDDRPVSGRGRLRSLPTAPSRGTVECRPQSGNRHYAGVAAGPLELTSFSLKDKVHIQDLDEVGLITPEIEQTLPEPLRARLAEVHDT
ncbi:MAG TPA: hypothetical protein VE422_17120 [Terriglobia bacterium]|nr:hypothetical protein [Terriglobia bacterium]